MSRLRISRRGLALLAVVVPVLAVFGYVTVRSGPLAPVEVVVTEAEERALARGLFGIGTVGVRYAWQIGPTSPGRVEELAVDVGDRVTGGTVMGRMEAVDLTSRIESRAAAYQAAKANSRQAQATQKYAEDQWTRYQKLAERRAVSAEAVDQARRELAVAQETVAAAQEQEESARAERQALQEQLEHLELVAPGDGLVVARHVEPGTTVVAGQAVFEVIDPASLWVDVRFGQGAAWGLQQGLAAKVVLRSRPGQALAGRVLRVEPLADEVTEELLAKVVLDAVPVPLPSMGELAEVEVALPPREKRVAVPNGALVVVGGRKGVWKVVEGRPVFSELVLGRADLTGWVEVNEGLEPGERVVHFMAKPLHSRSKLREVEAIERGKR